MELYAKRKEYIDGLSFKELLRAWRFSPIGDAWFEGEIGKYWSKRMAELRDKETNPAQVSKELGWINE